MSKRKSFDHSTPVRPAKKRNPSASQWVVLVVFSSLLVTGVASEGFTGLAITAVLFAVFAAFSALYALVLRRPSWMGLRRPAAAGKALAASAVAFLVSMVVFGATLPATEEDATAADADATATANPSVSAEPAESSDPSPSSEEPSETPSPSASSPEPSITPSPSPSATTDAAPEQGTALAQLETVQIKGRAPRTGYDRDLFGRGWKDPDRNGCDARNDMLNRDLTEVTHRPGTQGCVVASGVLHDPFTASRIDFVRGNDTSIAVQIDHVVALSDAWQKGAQQLDPNQREVFANDPLNLLAVDGPTNMAKSDSDAATWLPPNRAFRCEYVALQTAVKSKHNLWMTQAEHDAIRGILTNSCPDQPVPTDDGGVTVPVAVTSTATPTPKPAAPAPAPATTRAVQPAPAPAADVYYQNCTEVWAAGAGPIYQGDPGWQTKFDRDGDGIGCESRP
ncbi:MAG: GmrSD restriction endonuclease domain-containing protein [Micrococcaceae bacterium]